MDLLYMLSFLWFKIKIALSYLEGPIPNARYHPLVFGSLRVTQSRPHCPPNAAVLHLELIPAYSHTTPGPYCCVLVQRGTSWESL